MSELPHKETPELLKIVTLHDKGYGYVSNENLELFPLYAAHGNELRLVRLQPGSRFGNIKALQQVWTVTLLKGSIIVKVSRKKLLLEPYETAIIQPGPARSITNAAEHGVAEFLLAEFPEK